MRRRVATTLAVGAAAATLAACGSSGSNGSGSSANTPSSGPTGTTVAAAHPTTAAGPTTVSSQPAATSAPAQQATTRSARAAAKPVTVNKTINDPVLGEKTVVIKYMPYKPTAASLSKYSALQDEDVILVDVTATASSKYYDTMGADSFYLVADGTEDASTTILDSEIKAAGYPPLPDADTGKTTTGWVVFTPDKGAKKLVFRYKRLAAQTSNGKTITAKDFDIPLT
jgi:hypothetical protein